jgi:hypothetical protein
MKPPDRRRPRWCSSLLPLTLTLLSAALGCVCVCVCVWARVAERAEGQQLQSLLRQTRAAELALSALRPLLPNTTTTTTHPLAHSHTHTLPPPAGAGAGAGAAPVLARKPRPRQSPRPQPAAPLAPFSAVRKLPRDTATLQHCNTSTAIATAHVPALCLLMPPLPRCDLMFSSSRHMIAAVRLLLIECLLCVCVSCAGGAAAGALHAEQGGVSAAGPGRRAALPHQVRLCMSDLLTCLMNLLLCITGSARVRL